MDHEEVVLAGELDHTLEEAVRGHGAGRVVRVVDEHEARLAGRHRIDRVEVGDEPKLGDQRHQHRLRAREKRAARVDGIAGVGGQHDIVRVTEGKAEVVDALLGADGRNDLCLWVDLGAEALVVEAGERLAELLAAPVRGVVLV